MNLRIVRDRYSEENYRETGWGYVKVFYETHAPFSNGGKTIGIEKEVGLYHYDYQPHRNSDYFLDFSQV